jgi:hypothetical protein
MAAPVCPFSKRTGKNGPYNWYDSHLTKQNKQHCIMTSAGVLHFNPIIHTLVIYDKTMCESFIPKPYKLIFHNNRNIITTLEAELCERLLIFNSLHHLICFIFLLKTVPYSIDTCFQVYFCPCSGQQLPSDEYWYVIVVVHTLSHQSVTQLWEGGWPRDSQIHNLFCHKSTNHPLNHPPQILFNYLTAFNTYF